MFGRCARCGGERMERNLFCERCYQVVELMAQQGPVEPMSPWVKRAQERKLPVQDSTARKGFVL